MECAQVPELCGLCAQLAPAQEIPRVIVFAGYSRLGVDRQVSSYTRFNGWNAGMTTNLRSHLGTDVDLSVHYVRVPDIPEYVFHRRGIYTFLAGPSLFTVIPKFSRGTISSHIKAGFRKQWDSGSVFCMAAGGGFDLRISNSFGLRLVQADYLPVFFPEYVVSEGFRSRVANQFRLSSGLVFGLGRL